jgi:chemotaxis protein CheX
MNVQTPSLDIRHYLTGHLVEVFETMLSMKVTPLTAGQPPVFIERVTGSVGFGGDTVTGAVYLHLSAKFANRITTAMLGLPPDETIGETEVNDVIGECTNMLAGGLKSTLCDRGYDCAVSTPAIIRGTSFVIESPQDVQHELLVFDYDGFRFAVEVHIKFNQTN